MTAIIEQWTFRGAMVSDLEPAVALMNRCSQVSLGIDEFSTDLISNDWQTPGFDPSQDVYLAFDADGAMVGYIEIWALGKPPVRINAWMCVDPRVREHTELAAALIAWGEERVNQALERVPPELQVQVSFGVVSVDTYLQTALERAGYSHARQYYRMEIDLSQPIPEPQWPEGISLRTADPDSELERVVTTHRDVFKDHWGYTPQPLEHDLERWQHWLTDPNYDPEQWWIALDGDTIAGYAICWAASYDDPDTGWIGVLGVQRPWRRQGLALALLHHAFREFQQRGKARAGLGVDASSLTNAVALYERAGMRATRINNALEKIVRPGIDLSTQHLEQH